MPNLCLLCLSGHACNFYHLIEDLTSKGIGFSTTNSRISAGLSSDRQSDLCLRDCEFFAAGTLQF